MSTPNRIARNVMSSWAGYAVQAIAAFLLTPFVLRSLGETRYGVWTLAIGLTGYYGLLDFGISAGIGQYLTRYLAEDDLDRVNKTVSTGFIALSGCGALIFVVSIAVALNIQSLFRIPSDVAHEVALVIAIMGLSAALQFVFFTYSAVFSAVQRFDLSNGIGIATRLVSVAATILVLHMGYGLVGLSLALAGSNLLDYMIRWRVAKRLLPCMKPSFAGFSSRHFGEMMKFGVWNVAVAGGVKLISYADTLVIATFLPIAAVAPFAIAASLRSYFDDIFVRAGYVFFPAATALDAQRNTAGLQSLYLLNSKLMFLASVWCGLLGISWAAQFFHLWVGNEFANANSVPSVALIARVLLSASMISVGQRVGYQILQGIRKIPLLATLLAFEGVTNLLVSVVLVRRYGLIGVAIGTLLPTIVFQGVLQPFFVCRAIQIPFNSYSRRVLVQPALVFLAISPVPLIVSFIGNVDSWTTLVWYGLASLVATCPVVLLIGLNRTERNSVLVGAHAVVEKLLLIGRKGPVV